VVAAEIEETGPLSERMPMQRPMVDAMGWMYDPMTGAPLRKEMPRAEPVFYEEDEDGSPLDEFADD
jgi:hypothetical protein